MAENGAARRWIIVGLLAVGVVLAATLPRPGSEEPEEVDPAGASEARETPPPSADTVDRPDAGQASRRIKENCDPAKESLEYKNFIDKRALAILSWDGLSERAATLQIPVHVVGVENGAVALRFLDFPMRQQYLIIWLRSGHIRAEPENVFLLDPCSATIVEWPEMDEALGEHDDAGAAR